MKILVIGDLHGKKPFIPKTDFDCMVLVGDICGDNHFREIYKKLFSLLKGDRNFDWDETYELFVGGKQNERKYDKENILMGNKVLRYLDSFGKPIFMVAGNWDKSYGPTSIKDENKSNYHSLKAFYDRYLGDKINKDLIKGIKGIKNCMYKNHEFKGINFIGYGLSSAPENISTRKGVYKGKKRLFTKIQEMKLKRAYNKILDKLYKNYVKRKFKSKPTFFITHNIPYGTKLDIVREKNSYAYNKHLGSTIARDFIEKHQPLICVGGHVHEHRGKVKVGKTTVINTGFGEKSTVLINIDEKKGTIKKIDWLGTKPY